MLRNALLTALRSLLKRRGYTFMNIAGLALGLACFGFVSVWVQEERSYDDFHEHSEQIYRVAGHVQTDAETFGQAVTCPPMAGALAEEYPEVVAATRLDMNDAIVRYRDQQFKEDGLLFTDSSFFELFSFDMLQGDPATALSEPYSVVLTESMARKYFGDANPVGESLTIYLYDPGQEGRPYQVTGVVADPPENSHFDFQLLGSFSTAYSAYEWLSGPDAWFANFVYTYVRLSEGTAAVSLEEKLPAFAERHMGEAMDEYQMHYTFTMQPLGNIYLHSDLRYEIGATGEAGYLPIFTLVGLFILLLACINYVNLATARSGERAQEIGMRKILGARRGQLLWQFLAESLIVALAAVGVAFILMEIIRPAFYRLTDYPQITLFSPWLIAVMLGAAVLSGLLAGVYPALLISAKRPLAALQGLMGEQRSSGRLRRGLVVFQFSISSGLIVAVLTVTAQMNYIQEKDLGFDKENLFVLRVNGYDEVIDGYEAFRAELSSIPGIEGAARSNTLIVGGLSNGRIETVNEAGAPRSSSIYRLGFDADFLDVYNIKLVAGRDFSRDYGTDTTAAFLVNESTLATFGWPDAEAAIGKPIRIGDTQGQVVGVVENFHFSSLHEAVQPVLMYPNTGNFSRITLRSRLDPSATVDRVGQIWERHFPQALYDYAFFEGELLEQYQAEQRFGRLFGWFSGLSLFIACLGLFGLAAFSAERRAREISIRKVLGASVTQIVNLLNRDFLALVLLGLMLAAPVAWYAMHRWLENFAYHIDFLWWIPAIAGAVAVGLALLTVSVLSLRAANANPADHLRDQ